MTDVITIGECMVELARGADGRYGLAFGGDTFNTAVYLARAGVAVAYATRLGDDPYSDRILALAAAEGVATHLIGRAQGRMPGLYVIETADSGERSFWYWRDRAPARELFEAGDVAQVIEAIAAARLVYISGITLSLYTPASRDVLHAALSAAKRRGVRIAMDGNFRPRGWPGDVEVTRGVFRRFWSLADIALPTFDDEQTLWGDPTPDDTVARLRGLGIGEIVVKTGPQGAIVAGPADARTFPCPVAVTPVDTTAAGDSFNAAFIARRLAGDTPETAVVAGHQLAAVVIRHRGAIVPAEATRAVLAPR